MNDSSNMSSLSMSSGDELRRSSFTRKRKMIFSEDSSNMSSTSSADETVGRRRTRKQELKADFLALLKETSGIERNSRWSKIKCKINSDPRFKAINRSSQREIWFRDYTRKLEDIRVFDKDDEELVNIREMNQETVILGYIDKGDQNVLSYVKFVGVPPLSVYPRGKDNSSFHPDPLEQQQALYLNTIEKMFKIAFSGLRYADGCWQDDESMDRKLKDIKKMADKELQHYGWKIANNFIECRIAFLEGMYNIVGRSAICDILDLVGGLFSKQHNYFIRNVGGKSPRFKGSFNTMSVQIDKSLKCKPGDSTEMSRARAEEITTALTESTSFKHKRVVPDGQVYFETNAGLSIVLTAEVKSDKEATDEATYLKTWIQSVGALRKRDVTHGVTLTCIGGQLIKLLKDSDKRSIITTFQWYDFKRPDQTFYFEEFWEFFCGLVCILQKG